MDMADPVPVEESCHHCHQPPPPLLVPLLLRAPGCPTPLGPGLPLSPVDPRGQPFLLFTHSPCLNQINERFHTTAEIIATNEPSACIGEKGVGVVITLRKVPWEAHEAWSGELTDAKEIGCWTFKHVQTAHILHSLCS